jgi:hypothetical protein
MILAGLPFSIWIIEHRSNQQPPPPPRNYLFYRKRLDPQQPPPPRNYLFDPQQPPPPRNYPFDPQEARSATTTTAQKLPFLPQRGSIRNNHHRPETTFSTTRSSILHVFMPTTSSETGKITIGKPTDVAATNRQPKSRKRAADTVTHRV